MYRRPKFLEVLLAIREEMAREADYDPDLFAEMVRAGLEPAVLVTHELTEQRPVERPSENGPRKRQPSHKNRA